MQHCNIDHSKPWYHSKTFWINILMIIAGIAGGLAELLGPEKSLTLIAVINLILRVITKHSLRL